MTARRRTFTPAGAVGVSADVPPATPAPVSDFPIQEPRNIGQPVPAPVSPPVAYVPPTTDDEPDFSLDALMSNRVDPEMDLITRSYDIPRYLVEALRMESLRTRRPVRALVADYIRQGLPASLVTRSLANARRG